MTGPQLQGQDPSYSDRTPAIVTGPQLQPQDPSTGFAGDAMAQAPWERAKVLKFQQSRPSLAQFLLP